MKKALLAAAALFADSTALAQDRPSGSVAPPAMQRWAPDLTRYTDEVLFGDVWRRPDLTPRDRSLATVSALIATGKTEQLGAHLGRALDNGVTPAELSGIVTHLAFYSGWPNAVSALSVMERIFADRRIDPAAVRSTNATPSQGAKVETSAPITVVPGGQDRSVAPANRFTGSVVTDTAFEGTGESRISGARVTFSPGARTNWHRHPLGQLLVVTEGQGLVQDEGGVVRVIRKGDAVWTAPGVKHWHGASPAHAMSHIAVAETMPGEAVKWLEPVSDAQYHTRPRPLP